MKKYILENEHILVSVVPKMGGKSISIYEKEKKFELLAQPQLRHQNQDNTENTFVNRAAYGFDDAFPCIDGGSVPIAGTVIHYPDHGEIWSSSMQVVNWEPEKNKLQLYYESDLLHYRYQKDIWLKEHSVIYHYRITNQGKSAFPCIWAFHCLVCYEEDMQLVFPEATGAFENVIPSEVLGPRGITYQVEHREDGLFAPETSYRFDRVPMADSRSMEKYYVSGKVAQGHCGYNYPRQDVRCQIHYDAKKLPYLGFFVTAGGLEGDYNCALEPADGYYDSVKTAMNNQCCPVLQPGECKEFAIEITLF